MNSPPSISAGTLPLFRSRLIEKSTRYGTSITVIKRGEYWSVSSLLSCAPTSTAIAASWVRMRRRTLRTLSACRKITDSLIEQHHGRFVNSAGDSVLAEFASVVEAVTCAVSIQTALKAENAELPLERRMQFRIGVNLGDVMVEGEQIYGDGVNVAARLESLAEPGGICISDVVHGQVRTKLALRYQDLGERYVKNIAEPVRVLRVLMDGTIPAANPAKTIAGTKRHMLLAVIGVLLLAVIIYGVVKWRSPGGQIAQQPSANARTIRSIAVLPLDNFSGDPNQEYFADGMTDELTTDLASISALRVISRSSVMQYQGPHRPPAPEIARVLNVDGLVEGSVSRIGDRVRITAQLIDAPADRHLWAKSYERTSRDVLALQDELAAAIANEINVRLTPQEKAHFTSARPVNPAAYDAYLEGRYLLNDPSEQNLKKALAEFARAIQLDPRFAPAFAGLAFVYAWEGWGGIGGVSTSLFLQSSPPPKPRRLPRKPCSWTIRSPKLTARWGSRWRIFLIGLGPRASFAWLSRSIPTTRMRTISTVSCSPSSGASIRHWPRTCAQLNWIRSRPKTICIGHSRLSGKATTKRRWSSAVKLWTSIPTPLIGVSAG